MFVSKRQMHQCSATIEVRSAILLLQSVSKKKHSKNFVYIFIIYNYFFGPKGSSQKGFLLPCKIDFEKVLAANVSPDFFYTQTFSKQNILRQKVNIKGVKLICYNIKITSNFLDRGKFFLALFRTRKYLVIMYLIIIRLDQSYAMDNFFGSDQPLM